MFCYTPSVSDGGGDAAIGTHASNSTLTGSNQECRVVVATPQFRFGLTLAQLFAGGRTWLFYAVNTLTYVRHE
jgi:hypothetical protein